MMINQVALQFNLKCKLQNQPQISRKALLTKAFKAILFSGYIAVVTTIVFPAHAGTTTADFLKWERKSQDAFLQNSISMVGVVASQIKPKVAECLDEWYFKNSELADQRNTEILKVMAEYKEFRPQAFLMAYLEDECGRFDRN